MPNLVSFKVYLKKVNSEENSAEKVEVRRLGIEQDVATSYSYLVEKLKTIFPCLQDANDPIQLYWTDSENDKVSISSDAELIIALTEQTDTIKKIYINAAPVSSQEHAQTLDEAYGACFGGGDGSKGLHIGVVCDGCDGSIIGFRYKCVQCMDFDLCSACEAKFLHPEHMMLRIPSPVNRISGVKVCSCSGTKKGKCCCDGNGLGTNDFNVDCGPFSRRYSKKHWKHYAKKSGEYQRAMRQSLIDTIANVTRAADGYCPIVETLAQQPHRSSNEDACRSTNTVTPNDAPSTSASADASASANKTEATPTDNKNGNTHDIFGDLLSTFGPIINDSIQKHQKPFFDLLNEFLGENNHNNNGQSSNENNANSTDPSNKSTEVKVQSNEQLVDTNSGVSTDKPANEETSPVTTEKETTAVFTIINGDEEGSSTNPKQITITTSDFDKLVNDIKLLAVKNGDAPPETTSSSTVASAPSENVLKSSSSNSLDSQSSDDDGIRVKAVNVEQKEEEDGWMLLSEKQSDKSAIKTPLTGSANTGAIPKTKLNKEAEHVNPPTATKTDALPEHISTALCRMLAMGFTNEGNWLSDLLIRHNGDVAAVIDLLLPAKRNMSQY